MNDEPVRDRLDRLHYELRGEARVRDGDLGLRGEVAREGCCGEIEGPLELIAQLPRPRRLLEEHAMQRRLVAMEPAAPLPESVAEGEEISVRLRFLGLIPGWTHTLRIERLAAHEIASREHGGPVKAWDHRLTFQPTSPESCRYTDTVEVRAGLATPLVALFAHIIYRYRQARWRALARVLA